MSRVKRILEIVIVIAIVAVLALIVLRLVRYQRAMSTMISYNAPNQRDVEVTIPGRPHFIRTYVSNPESIRRRVTFRFSTNSEGLRGPEFSVNKPPGVYRILIVGECVAFGNGVADDETYAAQLQRLLLDGFPDRRIEVINAGLNASPPMRILQSLRERFVNYEPDLVFFSPGANTVFLPPHIDPNVPPRILLTPREYEEEMDRYRRVLEDAISLAETRGFRLVLVTPTCNTFFLPDGMKYVEEVRRVAAERGIPLLDTTALVRREERKNGLELVSDKGMQRLVAYRDGKPRVLLEVSFENDNTRHISPEIYAYLDDHPDVRLAVGIDENHPNARGHRRIAEEAYRLLREHHLLESVTAR